MLSDAEIDIIFRETEAAPSYAQTIDLPLHVVVKSDGEELAFDPRAFRKYCLMKCFGGIELTLHNAEEIRAFESLVLHGCLG